MSPNTALTLMVASFFAMVAVGIWVDTNSKTIIRTACIEAGKTIVDGDCVEGKP